MVSEINYDPETGMPTVPAKQALGISDPWAHLPVRRMIALYDYDPQELSPNPDTEVTFDELNRLMIKLFVAFNLMVKTKIVLNFPRWS